MQLGAKRAAVFMELEETDIEETTSDTRILVCHMQLYKNTGSEMGSDKFDCRGKIGIENCINLEIYIYIHTLSAKKV